MTATHDPDLVAALRHSRLFAELPDDDVAALAAASSSIPLAPGEVLMTEGSAPDAMYVVVEGELEVSRRSEDVELLLNVCGPGDLVGELGVVHGRSRSATVRARGPARVQRIGAEALDRLLAHPASARALLAATTARLDREEALLHQQERMAALGGLAAGLLHEVNNPASAVQRGASRLRDLLTSGDDRPSPLSPLVGTLPVPDDPLERADRETAINAALGAAGVTAAAAGAPLLRLGVDPAALTGALAALPPERRGQVVAEMARSEEVRALLEEISAGADYLSKIVSGVRPLAYAADQSVTEVDVRTGLEQALVLLRHKVPPGVRIVRDFDPQPQKVEGWAADLAMVWTNLLDNALGAVGDEGTVTVRTRGDADTVVVDIENTGRTVPPEVLDRAFDAFFTTKPIGKGSGLGLATSLAAVSQRHKGRLTLTSADGVTRARVELPRHQ